MAFYIAFISQRFHAVCLQPVIEKEIGATAHVYLMSLIPGLHFCFCVPSYFTHSAAFASTSIHSRFRLALRLRARCSSHHQAPFFISASSAAAGAGASIDQAAMERSLKAPMWVTRQPASLGLVEGRQFWSHSLSYFRKCHGCGLVLGDALAALQAHFRTCPALQALMDFV
jgi:hypothetical protein